MFGKNKRTDGTITYRIDEVMDETLRQQVENQLQNFGPNWVSDNEIQFSVPAEMQNLLEQVSSLPVTGHISLDTGSMSLHSSDTFSTSPRSTSGYTSEYTGASSGESGSSSQPSSTPASSSQKDKSSRSQNG